MTFDTAIPELFRRLPDLADDYQSKFHYSATEEPLPYVIFGSILVPTLEAALANGQTAKVATICAYLEDVAQSVREDARLGDLLVVEIGEWLGWAAHEDELARALGERTKQICRYVPGLATQRRTLRSERDTRSVLTNLARRFTGRSD